jgi:hypothetical protein
VSSGAIDLETEQLDHPVAHHEVLYFASRRHRTTRGPGADLAAAAAVGRHCGDRSTNLKASSGVPSENLCGILITNSERLGP